MFRKPSKASLFSKPLLLQEGRCILAGVSYIICFFMWLEKKSNAFIVLFTIFELCNFWEFLIMKWIFIKLQVWYNKKNVLLFWVFQGDQSLSSLLKINWTFYQTLFEWLFSANFKLDLFKVLTSWGNWHVKSHCVFRLLILGPVCMLVMIRLYN